MKSKPAAGVNRVRALSDWEQILRDRLPLYGHRNWIVVVDTAYPAQSRDGIETVVAGADHRAVVETVHKMIRFSRHVKPVVYTDQELKFVEEQDAPGISSYRAWLTQLLGNVSELPHEDIISKLDRAGQTFRILIVKSNITMPYTSVFFELDCAYWNADAEKRLRAAMKNGIEAATGADAGSPAQKGHGTMQS